MSNPISRFAALSPSRRRQLLRFKLDRLITKMRYAKRLRACGAASIIQKPLFWTPEHISVGSHVLIWPASRIEGIERYGTETFKPHITIGDNSILQQGLHITCAENVTIGAGANIMFGVMITDIDHDYLHVGEAALSQPLDVKKTIIGPNCFIGAGAKIQAGTILGEQCVVGTNAVVRGTFPDYCVIVGAPARIIKRYDVASGEWRKTTASGDFILDS